MVTSDLGHKEFIGITRQRKRNSLAGRNDHVKMSYRKGDITSQKKPEFFVSGGERAIEEFHYLLILAINIYQLQATAFICAICVGLHQPGTDLSHDSIHN